MAGTNKSREVYLQTLAEWRKVYDQGIANWQKSGATEAQRPFDVESLLQYDDGYVLRTISSFPQAAQKPLIDLWALNRATADVQNWSDEWRKAKSFSHGVVGGTFVGLFGSHLKAGISSAINGLSLSRDMAFQSSLAYHRAIDAALTTDEGTLRNVGLAAGIGAQIALPILAANSLSASSGSAVAQKAGFTALQGPVALVPIAPSTIGNVARFGTVDAAAYGAASCATSDCQYYRTEDGAVNGGVFGVVIGSMMPRAAAKVRINP